MTAINVVLQPRHRLLHVLTDGAAYVSDGTMVGYSCKQFAIPQWPGVIACRGPVLASAIIGAHLSIRCRAFDDAVDQIEEFLPQLEDQLWSTAGDLEYAAFQCILAGWSRRRNAPEAYLIQTDHERPDMSAADMAAGVALGGYNPDAYTLAKCDDMLIGPDCDRDGQGKSACDRVNYDGFDVDDSPERVVDDLRRCILVQRHTALESFGTRIHAVGGFAQLSTINPDGISQSILFDWSEDELGVPIDPGQAPEMAPWKSTVPTIDLSGLSRLQRRRMEKKARKGKLHT
jgi:hypothetical protein